MKSARVAAAPTVMGCRIPGLTKTSESWMTCGPEMMYVPLTLP